jgi:hypothetical protein
MYCVLTSFYNLYGACVISEETFHYFREYMDNVSYKPWRDKEVQKFRDQNIGIAKKQIID